MYCRPWHSEAERGRLLVRSGKGWRAEMVKWMNAPGTSVEETARITKRKLVTLAELEGDERLQSQLAIVTMSQHFPSVGVTKYYPIPSNTWLLRCH